MAEGGRHLRPEEDNEPVRPVRRPVSQDQVRRPARQQPRQPEPQPRRARPAEPVSRPVRRQPEPQPRRERPRQVAVEPPASRPRRRRGIRRQNIPLIILMVVLVGGILFAGGQIAGIILDYHRDRTAYDQLAQEAISSMAEPDATARPDVTPDAAGQTPAPVRSEVPIAVDWDLLREKNSDIVGWLYDPAGMSYPVMQTTDNSYYLHRGWDKQPNTAGSLFADTVATAGVLHSNFLIYGHNMKDGSMFAGIMKYVDQSYYDQHPTMYYLTPWQNYRVELIAAHIVESTLDNFPNYFADDGEYQTYLNTITSRSFFRTNAQVSTQYQLITLSTCDYSSGYTDPRFLVHGMLVPIQ